jgi:peptide/nickel transport system permease protein
MAYAARRVGVFLITVALASVAVFGILAVLPGDPASIYAGTQASPGQVEALREEYGLDASVPARYVDWVGGVLTGDLGKTFVSKVSISDQITSRLSVTLPLVALSVLLALAVAVPLGFRAATGHRKPSGTIISAVAQLGIAIPAFWAGLLLVAVVAVRWQLLPGSGFTRWGDSWWGALKSLILPAVSLALVQAAILTRYIRSAVLEVISEDYVRTARAKGMTMRQALRRHGVRNAAIPVVTVLGLQLSSLFVGAVVIENVFALPGLGKLLLDAIGNREVILIQDIIMFLVVASLTISLVVDLVHVAIDPRLRKGAR